MMSSFQRELSSGSLHRLNSPGAETRYARSELSGPSRGLNTCPEKKHRVTQKSEQRGAAASGGAEPAEPPLA